MSPRWLKYAEDSTVLTEGTKVYAPETKAVRAVVRRCMARRRAGSTHANKSLIFGSWIRKHKRSRSSPSMARPTG
jgi:hypothetical protein